MLACLLVCTILCACCSFPINGFLDPREKIYAGTFFVLTLVNEEDQPGSIPCALHNTGKTAQLHLFYIKFPQDSDNPKPHIGALQILHRHLDAELINNNSHSFVMQLIKSQSQRSVQGRSETCT